MHAKFGRGPTVVSKKGSLKFISRYIIKKVINGLVNTHSNSEYSRTPILRSPSKSDWSGRKTGMVVHEGLDYFITCGLRHTHIYILTVSSTLRTSFGVHCRTRENRATYPLQRLQARPQSPCLTQNSVGLRWPRFLTTMPSFSWINLPNISISGLIKPRSENIVQILVATFTLLALRPHSFYFNSILRNRFNLRLADPQVDDFPFSILSIIRLFTILKLFPARFLRQPM